ncbi:hypothetical protein ACFQL0_13145 [Haloplanus litoreus]|uniref:hypothetical protein n=1 Tax=Haloplanus litoreus TaxID=767515 RepID=UPI003612A087
MSATTLTLSASNSDPRKDVLYIDSEGTPQVAEGHTAPAQPSGETRRDTYQPRPADLSATDAAVVAEVWVGGGVSDTASGDISDRRVFADIRVGDIVSDSHTTDERTTGKTVTPAPAADLTTFIPNYAGHVIDLAGREYTVSSTVTVPSPITIRNGTIKPDSNSSVSDFTSDWMMRTDPTSDHRRVEFENVTFGPRNAVTVAGIQFNNVAESRCTSCTFEDMWGNSLQVAGKNSSQNEWGTLRVADCQFNGCTLQVNADADYVMFVGCDISNQSTLTLAGENNTVASCHVSAGGTEDKIIITGNKNKIYATTINHTNRAIVATGCSRLHIDGVQSLISAAHAVYFDGVTNSTVDGLTVGRAGNSTTGDAVHLTDTTATCTRNVIRDVQADVYANDSPTTRDVVHETTGVSGNKIHDCTPQGGAGLTLNSTTTANNTSI